MKKIYLTAIMLLAIISFSKSQDLQGIKDTLTKWIDFEGSYEKAFPLTLETTERLRRDSGENNITYAEFLYSFPGPLYELTGDYKTAEYYYKKGMDLSAAIKGDKSISYAEACGNLGNMYNKTGLQHAALTYAKIAYDILNTSPDAPGPSLGAATNNLARIYQFLEQYAEAQKLYNRLLPIMENDSAYAPYLPVVYNNLGSMYLTMGAYKKALVYYNKLEVIFGQYYSEPSVQNISIKANIAVLKTYNGNFKDGITMLLQLDSVLQKLSPQNPSLHITVLGKLAGALYAGKKYKQAEQVLSRAADTAKKYQLTALPVAKNNDLLLANLYVENKNYRAAESMLLSAVDSVKAISPQIYFGYLLALERLYFTIKQPRKAEVYLQKLNTVATEIYDNNFAFLSGNDKLMLLPVLQYALYSEINIMLSKPVMNDKEKNELFTHCMAMKARLLQDQRTLLNRLHASDNDRIRNLYTKWINNRRYLNKEHYKPEGQRSPFTDSIQVETENQETQLTRLLKVPSSNFLNLQQLTIKEVQAQLKSNEAVIEYIKYNTPGVQQHTYEDEYMVMIVTKGVAIPIIKKLCSEKDLVNLIPDVGAMETDNNYLNKLYVDSRLRNKNLSYAGDKIYDLLIKPLLPYLKDINTVYCSTDGLINTIALHALPINTREIMLDRFNIRYLSSCTQLMNNEDRSAVLSSATVWGGIDYNTTDTALTRGENKPYWRYLPASRTEAVSINKLLEKNNIHTLLYTGDTASKSQFDSLSGKDFNIVHISTHGYSQPSPGIHQYAFPFYFLMNGADENSMLYSGLVLAGANHYIDSDYSDKGYIDAYEIAAMDFSDAYLVTLSACETAVGRDVNGEGIFGLNRAFSLAGAKNMIVSLWQVPDKETTEFMLLFYTKWLQGAKLEAAFEAAQRTMKEKYTPYYWAAFKLIKE